MLTCEHGESLENAVVYIKVHLEHMSDTYKLPSSQFLPQQPTMEELNTKIDRLNSQDSITTGFKLHYLNTTLKFLKDDTQLSLVYPNLTGPQADLITTLTCNPNVDSDIGFGYKSFYAPLWEAIKIIGLKYEFRIRNLNGDFRTKCLVLEKIPKLKKEIIDNKPVPMDTSESDVSFQNETKSSKNKSNKSATIMKSLSSTFIHTALKSIMEFYKDDAQASVTFSKLSENECYFLVNFKNIMASKRMQGLFEKNVRKRIENVKYVADSKNNYKLSVKKAKMCNTQDKAMTFTKVPVFEKPLSATQRLWANMMEKKDGTAPNISKNRSVSRERGSYQIKVNSQSKDVKVKLTAYDSDRKSVDSPVVHIPHDKVKGFDILPLKNNLVNKNIQNNINQPPPKTKYVTDSIASESSAENVNSPTIHRARDKIKDTAVSQSKNNLAVSSADKMNRNESATGSASSTDRSVSKDRKAINFYKGGVLDHKDSEVSIDTDSKSIEDHERERMRDKIQNGGGLNNRKTKLLEAMSVPLKSDKAMKMMIGMGWDGGALGLRGEGITEPIIPALEIVTGAGLGHTKPQKQQARSPKSFRIDILEQTLQLVSSEALTKTIPYKPKLQKTDVGFVKYIIESFNMKRKVELLSEEMVIADQIAEKLRGMPGVVIQALPLKKNRGIQLIKSNNQTPQPSVRKMQQMERIHELKDKLKNILHEDLDDLIRTIGPACLTVKNYKLFKFHIETLISIYEFVKSDNGVIRLAWKETISKKMINCINSSVLAINIGTLFGSTKLEEVMCLKITEYVRDYEIEHIVDKLHTSVTFRKIFKNINRTIAPKNSENDKLSSEVFNNLNENKINTDDINNINAEDIAILDNTNSQTTQSEIDGISSSDEVIIINGKESPLLSEKESDLLKSSSDNLSNFETDNQIIDLGIKLCDQELESDIGLKKGVANDISKEDFDCNTCIKRCRTESLNSDKKVSKKTKLETKKVHIVHFNHPNDVLNKEDIQNVQKLISDNICETKDLPLLKCYGVQDGALVYSCHTEKSYDWLRKTISVASDVKILDTKEVIEDAFKMALKFNCYFDFDVNYLFSMLELYNKGLSTSKWMVLKHNIFLDHVSFVIKMDGHSYFYIRNSGYSLYAGVDEVQFSIIWD